MRLFFTLGIRLLIFSVPFWRVQMTGEVGSYRYMAPEVVMHEPYNAKADMYSWAILSWEILAVDRPYAGMDERNFIKVCFVFADFDMSWAAMILSGGKQRANPVTFFP